MEEITTRLLAKIRGSLAKDHDVTTLDGQLFLLFNGEPFLITVEQAQSIIIKTERGTFNYPPRMLPPKDESEAEDVEKEAGPDQAMIKELKKIPLSSLNTVIKDLGIDGALKRFLPDKPKKIDIVIGLATMFNQPELEEGKSLIYEALGKI